ncbi:uncharacterized protein TRAVEDRAFT_148271 [Trametes versicolor FP-101664 SS1]|uniref:uncharacterized protein n=1 Tax=Trametes versicolor (strain FP-101664) TaxID=717944 RepID=UPI000462229C|nr:uncharacterized protein TRAVEDRAFT_148271 [Trametes versicolor FP-101664 SS1]EIW58215.1 hypothetical protein TRAVEDRAFT_148271 [Trametes versicolor FP-101664 SS1]
MPKEQEIVGSAGRDFAMLERNLLSHLRLAVLLSLLSSSLLLHTRLPIPSDPGSAQTPASKTGLATAIIEVIAAVAAIAAGVWEYWQGYADMNAQRGFLRASQTHLAVLSGIGLVVFATCMMLIAKDV